MSNSSTSDTPSETPSEPSTGIVHRVLHSVRSHPVLTGVLVLGVLVALGLSVYIDMGLYFTIPILVMIGVIAFVLFRLWRSRRPADEPVPTSTAGRVGFAAVALAGVLTFLIIQLVPYGRDHSNPPGTGEPDWATPNTRELMVNACFGCHSNEVEYPPYASVAPISWMVQRHVDEGREAVNYSNFATNEGEADNSVEVVQEGEMPPAYFARFGLHPEADLSQAEMDELIAGLKATPGMSEGG
jgi:uncharacterized membrane protein YedE/YeeE